MHPVLPVLSILGYWAIILGSLGGPGRYQVYKASVRSPLDKSLPVTALDLAVS